MTGYNRLVRGMFYWKVRPLGRGIWHLSKDQTEENISGALQAACDVMTSL